MTDECRVAFEKWCVDVAGYTSGEVATRILHSDKYLPAIEGDWITWQAAWNSRRAPDARTEVCGGTPIVCPCCQGHDIKQDTNYLYHWECKTCAYQWDVTLRDRQP